MKLLPIAISAVISLPLCGCYEQLEPEAEPRAVIEGWLDSEGYPRVIFTSSFVPGESDATIADKLIRWGKVTISDGDTTIIMTGGPDKNLFPPYSYYTYEMQGEPGKTYTITADFEQFHAEASAKMPDKPLVAEVRTEKNAECDTIRSVTVVITAPEDCPAYYHVSTQVITEDFRYYPSIMGCVMAELPGESVELPVFRGKSSLSEKDFVPGIPTNRAVRIKVERVTREIYEFWCAFNEATLFGGSQFTEHSTSLPTNITGGYGYWSPQGVVIIDLPAL